MPRRIGIVGAGDAGTLAANRLASGLGNEIRAGEISIELFGKESHHDFQPGNLDVAFKGAAPDRFVKEESSLLKKGVVFKADPVTSIQLKNRTIALGNGATRSFDHLILATGAETFADGIEGLAQGGLFFHNSPFDSQRAWSALKNFNGGKIAIVISGLPHKCPPSPNEAAFLIDDYLRRRGIRDQSDIKFITPYPRSYPAEEIAKTVQNLFDKRGIEVVPFFNIDFVDPKNKTVNSLEGEKFNYDLLFAVPPHRGAKVIRDSGIAKDDDGWIPTDKWRLNIKGYDDIYALGDATDIPISKSGVVAHLEAEIVAKNLVESITGSSKEPELYNGRINCPMEVGGRKAIFVSATYTKPPNPQSPSLIKYAMKRGFGMMYWSAMKGSWKWLFDAYFGKTTLEHAPEEALPHPPIAVGT